MLRLALPHLGLFLRHLKLIFIINILTVTTFATQTFIFLVMLFTARCYAKRGIAMGSCVSVSSSVCNVKVPYFGHVV